MTQLKSIVLLAFGFALGILLLILSCALYQNWYPMLTLIPFFLSTLPSLSKEDIGYFFTSVFVVSGFGLVLVLNHALVISSSALGLALGACVFFNLSILGFMYTFNKDDDW
jgi:hypothetical protein